MSLTKERKTEVIQRYRTHETDSGSARVQIALLTARIDHLTEHFKTHMKDHHSRRGLLRMVGKRRRLLNYLKDHHPEAYQQVLKELNLRK